jgi:DUF2934 family protein
MLARLTVPRFGKAIGISFLERHLPDPKRRGPQPIFKLSLTIDQACLSPRQHNCAGAPMDDLAVMERIRECAYYIWAANGGDAEQNWLQAEAEILNNAAVQSPKAQPQKKQPFRRRAKKTASS